MMMLGSLMAAHLMVLGMAVESCDRRSERDQEIGPVCQGVSASLQQAAETYLAVLLALLAPISRAD